MLVWTVFLLGCATSIAGFNIDESNPIVFTHDANDSYFGYTTALFIGRYGQATLYVGAPKDSFNWQHSGAVYSCGLSNGYCYIVPYPLKDATNNPLMSNHVNFKDGFIGGSMDISLDQKFLAVGAPHAFEKTYPRGYVFRTDLNTESTTFINPLKNVDTSRWKNGLIYYAGVAQAGFSLNIPKNSSDILMGAPGLNHWGGGIVNWKRLQGLKEERRIEDSYGYSGYALSSGYYYADKQLYYAVSKPGEVHIRQFNAKIKDTLSNSQFGDFFGAAICSGDINNDQLDDLIVSAPFYSDKDFNEGRVSIWHGNAQKLKFATEITGKSSGGYFGLTLAYLGDINSDNFGDVAIAAPYENGGTVYIHQGCANGLTENPAQIIKGRKFVPNIGGFGISISKPVDLDSNGFSDIAIGAYLSGHVVVLRSRPVVVITTFLDPLNGITSLKQGSKDFAMRAVYLRAVYRDSTLIVLRRNITVDEDFGRVSIDNYIHNKEIRFSDHFAEDLNFTIRPTTNFNNPIVVTLTYEFVDQQTSYGNMTSSGKGMEDNDHFCLRCPVLDVDRSSGPIKHFYPFELHCGSNNICDSNLTINATVQDILNNTYILGSRDNLKVSISVKNWGEIAYATKLDILIKDLNFRKLPTNCETQKSLATSEINCFVDQALGINVTKTIEIELDMTTVNYDETRQFIEIQINVLTLSNNINPKQNHTVLIKLQREADIIVSGYSDEQSYLYGNSSEWKPTFIQTYQVEKVGISPIQLVKIEIKVPYAFRISQNEYIYFLNMSKPIAKQGNENLQCNSAFSYLVSQNDYGEISELDQVERSKRQADNTIQLEDKFGEEAFGYSPDEIGDSSESFYHIRCDSKNVLCDSVICDTSAFKDRVQRAVVQLKMVLDTSAISNYIGKKKSMIVLSTNGSALIEVPKNFVQTGNGSDYATVQSFFLNEKSDKISLFVIIGAVVLGFILLLVLVAILFKAGFFKRTKKEQLEEWKARASAEICTQEIGVQEEDADLIDDVFMQEQIDKENEGMEKFTPLDTDHQ